ncbi:MATE efflux family protein [Salinarchaeum sp. Harcht-Bsk1]|uniref:MATE family efflux transporter n=1 Tax=Salinarchaeum sp. Harcht-Bsk1 TaxID=1333523 RepID=UPI0003423ECC|nr:MATE family efflux transporter [Salinarchaeum sp. Harcht-Bsk1]AGN00042.1 MATE efflux family protein [Salinarchaeum sp. Harcht-Bsk1]
MSKQSRRENLTDGGLARPLARLAWPIVVIQLLQVTYNIADTIYLGWYDPTAVAAISLAFPLLFLIISVAGGFTTAGSILVAQYTGAEGERSAGRVAGQTLAFVGSLSVLLAILGFLVVDPALAFLPTEAETGQEVVPQMAAYLKVLFLGLPAIFGFFVFSALMRGYGDTRTPMRIMAGSVALNVVADPILIFGLGPAPELGIVGAAIASMGARGLATLAGLHVLFRTNRGPSVSTADLPFNVEIIRQILSIGVPSALEQSMAAVAMVTLTAMVAQFGPPVAAAYGVGNRLVSLVFLPAMGVGRATNTMVGQNLGADKADRAERAVWLGVAVSGGVMAVVALVAYAVPEPIVAAVIGADTEYTAESIALGTDYLRIRSIEFVFIGIMQVVLGGFRGAGNTRTALAISMVTLWVARVPTVFYLTVVQDWGPTGIWIGMTIGHILGTLVAVPWFLRGTWKEAVIDEDDPRGPSAAAE